MAKARYLRSIRLLSECYHAFAQRSSKHVRTLDYTPAQFDIIATLGNTSGMCFKELGEKTLITKGTLTGVVDRLERKGIVKRVNQAEDKRRMLVQLTTEGESEFVRIFQPHIDFFKNTFSDYNSEDFDVLDRTLHKFKQSLLRTK